MDDQLLQDFPALFLGQVQGDGLLVAAFVQEGAAAEIAVDVVFEHVALAAEGHQLPERASRRGVPP